MLFATSFGTGCGPDFNPELKDKLAQKYADKGYGPGSSDGSYPIPQYESGHRAVTDKYGPLVVEEGEFGAEARVIPWSSYWFPFAGTFLFEGSHDRPGPLEKYDAYARTLGITTHAADKEREFYNPTSTWAGHCHAWARAAILAPEPKADVVRNGIRFTVGDQKALLLKTYMDIGALESYGQRRQGVSEDDYHEIYPDQLHRFIQHELVQNRRPFMMNKDPGIEIWNVPVYRVHGTIARDPQFPRNVLNVKIWITYSDMLEFEQMDEVGWRPKTLDYTYDLVGDFREDGKFEARWGVWTGDSATRAHPSGVTRIPDQVVVRKSANTDVQTAIVDQILGFTGVRGTPWN